MSVDREKISRRTFLASAGALAGGAVLAACGSSSKSAAPTSQAVKLPPSADYLSTSFAKFLAEAGKNYQGTELNILAVTSPQADAMNAILPTFTALTGIHVNLDTLSNTGNISRTAVTLSSKSSAYDLYQVQSFYVPQYANNRWLSSVEELSRNKKVTAPQFSLSAYEPASISQLKAFDKLWALPMFDATQVFYYQKDVFSKAGITKLPTSLTDLVSICKIINKKPVPAIAMRSAVGSTENLFCWTAWLYNYGGSYFQSYDRSTGRYGAPALTSPAAIAAAGLYATVLREYGVPGGLDWTVADVSRAFETGSVAMIQEGNTFAGTFDTPATSAVAGKVGAFAIPAGPKGSYYPGAAQGWAVSRYSSHADAAWLFAQWATNPEASLRGAIETKFPAPPVASALTSKQFKSEFPMPGFITADEQSLAGKSSPIGGPYIPGILNWDSVGHEVSISLNKIITGELSPEAGMNSANGALAGAKFV